MKSFIDRIFKAKQQKKAINEPVVTETNEKATEAVIKSIEIDLPKPKHFPDCTCVKCLRWRSKYDSK